MLILYTYVYYVIKVAFQFGFNVAELLDNQHRANVSTLFQLFPAFRSNAVKPARKINQSCWRKRLQIRFSLIVTARWEEILWSGCDTRKYPDTCTVASPNIITENSVPFLLTVLPLSAYTLLLTLIIDVSRTRPRGAIANGT